MRATLLVAALLALAGSAQAEGLETQEVVAAVRRVGTPKATLSSALDAQGRVHVAWMRDPGVPERSSELVYTVFDKGAKTTRVLCDAPYQAQWAPSLAVDARGAPHVVWMIRKAKAAGTRPGNFAVLYATVAGDKVVREQVSTNPQAAESKEPGPLHCYVNDRPQLALDAKGLPYVVYYGASSDLTKFKHYLIEARRRGGAWARRQLFDPGTFGTFSVSNGLSLPSQLSGSRVPLAWIEIGGYAPLYRLWDGKRWVGDGYPAYGAYGAIKDARVEVDAQGTIHVMWHTTHKKKAKVNLFCWVQIKGERVSAVRELPLTKRVAGNFRCATIDPTTGRFYGFVSHTSSKGTLVSLNAAGAVVETPLTGVGAPLGKRSLHVRGGRLALVTGRSNRLYVTTGTLPTK